MNMNAASIPGVASFAPTEADLSGQAKHDRWIPTTCDLWECH